MIISHGEVFRRLRHAFARLHAHQPAVPVKPYHARVPRQRDALPGILVQVRAVQVHHVLQRLPAHLAFVLNAFIRQNVDQRVVRLRKTVAYSSFSVSVSISISNSVSVFGFFIG